MPSLFWNMLKHYIIPLFIPHEGCPHQCVFCNQRRITGVISSVTPADIERLIQFHLAQITRPYFVEAAFYGGSFTALPAGLQQALLAPAAEAFRAGRLDAIRLSTRPDAIEAENLERLRQCGVKTIELGAQSFDDGVLALAGRGHCAADTRRAAELIRAAGMELGLQLMPGLPGETAETLQRSLEAILELKPSMVRLYPTVVLRDTVLARLYELGKYTPLTIEEAARIAAVMKLTLEQAGIKVIRTGLQASEELDGPDAVLAGPYHPAFGELTENEIYRAMLEELLKQSGPPRRLIVYYPPADTSRLRGVGGRNVRYLQEKYPETELFLYAAPIGRGRLMINADGQVLSMTRSALRLKLTGG